MATTTGIYFKEVDLRRVMLEFRNSLKKKNWEITTYSNDYSKYHENSVLFGIIKENEDWISIVLPDFCIDPLERIPLISVEQIVSLSKKLNNDCIVFSWQSMIDYCYWCYIEKGAIRRLHSDISADSTILKKNIGTPFEFEDEIKSNDKYWVDVPDDIRKNALTYDWADEYCKRFGLYIECEFTKCEWYLGFD